MLSTSKMIQNNVNYILCLENLTARFVEKHWITRFLKRNSRLHKRRQASLTAKRKNAHNMKKIERHFRRFRACMNAFDVKEKNLYNMNEIDFRINCGKSHIVITLKSRKKLYMIDFDNRDYIISIEYISADKNDYALLAFLIYASAWVLKKWCLENDFSNHITIVVSESEYSNDELSIEWIQYFHTHTESRRVETYRMLVMNDHDSHMTTEFLDYVTKHNILLFTFSSHATHLLQSLDIDVFQSYKHWYARDVDTAMRCNETKFKKLDFFALFLTMHAQTMTLRTISRA